MAGNALCEHIAEHGPEGSADAVGGCRRRLPTCWSCSASCHAGAWTTCRCCIWPSLAHRCNFIRAHIATACGHTTRHGCAVCYGLLWLDHPAATAEPLLAAAAAQVSYAPAGCSVGPHSDQYDVFLLQATGRKSWAISGDPCYRHDNAAAFIEARCSVFTTLAMHVGYACWSARRTASLACDMLPTASAAPGPDP